MHSTLLGCLLVYFILTAIDQFAIVVRDDLPTPGLNETEARLAHLLIGLLKVSFALWVAWAMTF